MLQYEEKNKRDPDILNYSLKCGIVVIILVVLLYTVSIYIFNSYVEFSNIIIQGISYTLEVLSEIEKYLNKTAVLYSTWASMAIAMWSLCIMLKVKQNYQKSKKFWKALTLSFLFISTVLTFFTIYMMFNEESLFLIKAIITCWIFITVVSGLSYISDDSAYRQYRLED